MNTFNYRMLAVARELRGYTQLDLVNGIPGLNQGNYSKMEKGLLTASDDVLLKISQCLDIPVNFFYKGASFTKIEDFYYRKRISIPMKDLSPLEAKFKLLGMWIDELLDSVSLPEFRLPPIEVSSINSPEQIARKVRNLMNISSGPIIEIVRYFEASGILVYFIKNAPEKFDGITILTNSGQPIIFINESISNDRKRFTLAHELGHLIMHIRFSDIEDEDVLIEKQADHFASEFLVPFLEVRDDLVNLQFKNLGILKMYWKVSKASIIHKANYFGFLTPSRYKTFMIELSRNGERKREYGEVSIDNPVLVNKLIDAHLNKLHYSKDELLNILCISDSDFRHFFESETNLAFPKLKISI